MRSRPEILDLAASCLEEADEYLLSLAGLRDRLDLRNGGALPSLGELETWLREDERFDLVDGGGMDPALPPEALALAGIAPYPESDYGPGDRRPRR